ncbi:hypothetical protein Poli38472_008066 [Pythium oligandrum]|uniref:subtilisin n=1 Tax=Pythium oligandrum TaxID=41045 RepID=A0A8K1CKY5_PYTOL|nr:hypothetical protein Poli38472_008066 [Pythium oligandrum]|eukprot:TMW65424.1 hypothetical protein Poli38472_008066 [Pythium oligandrum]
MVRVSSTVLALSLVVGVLLDNIQDVDAAATRSQRRTNVIVTMKQRTTTVVDSIGSQKFTSRGQRVKAFKDGLEGHARTSQADVLSLLDRAGKTTFSRTESYWLTNQMLVAGATQELVELLSMHPDVASVAPEQIFPLVHPVLETAAISIPPSSASTQWGVKKINAPAVWATGNMGEGITIGIIDTGVRATHVAIKGNWRSTYGWFDPEKKALTPYDATGHGTHVTGIIAGNNGIGVAPNAQWIMCKGCRSTGCFSSDLLACFQFMTCPTRPDGTGADCSRMPRVVSNSWGGGKGLTTFDEVINTWRKAGIIPVFAAGNTGPSCGSIQSPGDNANIITVGSTDSLDGVSRFSAKGPTTKGLLKPDITAPGSAIKSSCYTGDTDYCSKSGTSMATPHVAGAIALYLKSKPSATYDQVKQAFQSTSLVVKTATGYTCGGTLDSTIPNNQFDYGRLDISKAVA